MINISDLIAKFRYALDNGWGYIWGTAGVKWTEAKQKAATREQTVKYGSKWIGHYVADCSGLFSWAFKQLGGQMYHGSNTMYLKWCTDKGSLSKGKRSDGKALKPGTAVFCWDGSTYSHVGLFVGDGTVIEAAGTRQGVITSKVTDGKWVNWGELKGVDYSGSAPEPAPEPTPAPDQRPTLRRGDKGPYVVELQTDLKKLGYGLGPCGIDGDFGRATKAAVEQFQLEHRLTVDGICGPKTWAAIDTALAGIGKEEEVKITYTVVVSGLDLSQAKKLAESYPGAEIVKGD